ncbi:MAG: biopolymer transporter ExbD [Bacteroidales bacterium]|nr:biopolymer transporter ExbD [Bacteroidales bacterium]
MSLHFDVWFLTANQIYKAVPFTVVTDWAEQGRVGAEDKLRPTGVDTAWMRVADHPQIRDFLFVRPAERRTEPLEPIALDVGWRTRPDDDDDDVDMIPLIDISLVLLIFFMMTAAVATVSPIAVPDMKHASTLAKDANAVTVDIDRRSSGEIIYHLRLGNAAPAPEDANLLTREQLLTRLDARLGEYRTPPEVRIACNKELPRVQVRDVARELDKRKQAGKVAYYGAEVNEVTP